MSSDTTTNTTPDTSTVTQIAKWLSFLGTKSSPTRGSLIGNLARIFVIACALFFALFPVIWIISASFNPTGSMSTQTLIPKNADSISDVLVNFRRLFDDPQIPFWRWIGNSIFVSSITTILILTVTSLSAYAFSRFRFTGRRNVLLLIFLVQVFPSLLAMVAIYLMLVQIGKYIPPLGINTYGGLIMVYIGGGMATNIWLMKGYFDTIPRDIDESAQVDGATHMQTFWYLIFPLVRPILAVVGLLGFVGPFNDFLLARIILTDRDNWTLMVGMFSFVEGGEFSTDWGVFAAGSLIAAIPIVVLYLALQRFIVGGLTVGAVKG
ncbi:MAG: sugar ABC transporter permease [Anaerolineae bacterium]|nr:sugar ABC transporter permease [Anaerolineae bacterium]